METNKVKKGTNMEKREKSLLHTVYTKISKYKSTLTQSRYFDYIVNTTYTYDTKTKEKYIRYSHNMPRKIQEYYREKSNKTEIKIHLQKWCDFLKIKQNEIQKEVIEVLNANGHKDIAEKLQELAGQKPAKDTEFYYQLFRYCILGEYDEENDSATDNDRALMEFNENILMQYGISGNTGKNVIMQIARSGTDNPYILFEAAEIEYMKKYNTKSETDDIENCLDRAYEYYKRASDIGFPLADWSLGYLAQKCVEKAWHVKAYENMTDEEKIREAVDCYLKAEKEGCSKAFNSLGNIVAHSNIKPEWKHGLKSAKDYYYQAAIRNNVFGMFNYAKTLEAELREEIKRTTYPNHDKAIAVKGKEMLDYFKKSADLGHPNACYRYALYYGHLIDEKTAITNEIQLVKKNKVLAIKYLEKAIKYHDYELYYDACLFLAEYIIRDKRLFFHEEAERKRAIQYINMVEENLIEPGKANKRQKEQVAKLKKLIAINNVG